MQTLTNQKHSLETEIDDLKSKLAAAGTLTYPHVSSRILTYPHVWLTYAHVSKLGAAGMLTYADVWLTYADVCTRMLTYG
jgi:hypothetical protein